MNVDFGIESAIDLITDTETGVKTLYRHPHIKRSTVEMRLVEPDLFGCFRDVVNLWPAKSDRPPVWVDCVEDREFESVIAKHFGCTAGKPDDWEHEFDGPSLMVPDDPELVVPTEAEVAAVTGKKGR